MREAFMEGGWGMWPTLLLGTLALALAVRHAIRPKAALVPLIVGLGISTIAAGGLGLVIGVITTFRYVRGLPIPDQGPTVLIGIGESLQNVALALGLAVLVATCAGIGSYRARLAAPTG